MSTGRGRRRPADSSEARNRAWRVLRRGVPYCQVYGPAWRCWAEASADGAPLSGLDGIEVAQLGSDGRGSRNQNAVGAKCRVPCGCEIRRCALPLAALSPRLRALRGDAACSAPEQHSAVAIRCPLRPALGLGITRGCAGAQNAKGESLA